MGMPLNLIFVRHGESEGNVANRASRAGDNSHFENESFRSRHSSQWRLSDIGVEQAKWAGDTIRAMNFSIGRRYTSPYFRAMETMAYMKLGGVPVYSSYELRERSWGLLDRLTHDERMETFSEAFQRRDEDPFLWEPPGGEPLVSVYHRVKDLLATIARECGDMACVVISCHEEIIKVVRVILERKLPHDYRIMDDDPSQGIWNGAILHYTRVDPQSPDAEPAPFLNWVRLITPPDAHLKAHTGFDWMSVQRTVFSDDELLAYVEKHAPRIPR